MSAFLCFSVLCCLIFDCELEEASADMAQHSVDRSVAPVMSG
jgi:hypothetical protein